MTQTTFFRANALTAVVAGVAALLAGAAMAADQTLRSSDVTQMGRWYGRAGGLVGSDRVAGLKARPASQVMITFDKAVAERTNMQRTEAGGGVSVTYDADVAARTNMPRGEQPQPRVRTVRWKRAQ